MRKHHNGKHPAASTMDALTYVIHFDLRCTNKSGEFVPTTKERNEQVIRDVVSKGLHDLFTQVSIDKVSIVWVSKEHTFPCFQIGVNAHCSQQRFSTVEGSVIESEIEGKIESHTIHVFGELFTTTTVDTFVVRSLPTTEWNHILSQ